MQFEASRVIVLSAPHELRRDLAELVAGARSRLGAAATRPIWEALRERSIDVVLARNSPGDAAAFFAALRALDAAARGFVLLARSTIDDVAREVPASDDFGRNLRLLRAGEVLAAFDHLILAFDDARHPHLGLLGERDQIAALAVRLGRLADQTLPVLVTGETGTGKEVVARALHRLGRRRDRTWLAMNCAELPESILESELFGHARGSFTGAAGDRPGLFEAAGDGTVFLDEIGELPPPAQAKLLRVLEEHRVRRLGSSRALPLDCRIVAATNRDLPQEIEAGRFRRDLFYRLRGAEIALRPLRERPLDVLALGESFAARAALRFRRRVDGISEQARLALLAHPWPGNVRELRQVIEAAVLAAPEPIVALGDLSLVAPELPAPPPALVTADAAERAHIVHALVTTSGNKVAAARLLGLTRQSLQRRIARHGISVAAGNERNAPEAVGEGGLARSAVIRPPRQIP